MPDPLMKHLVILFWNARYFRVIKFERPVTTGTGGYYFFNSSFFNQLGISLGELHERFPFSYAGSGTAAAYFILTENTQVNSGMQQNAGSSLGKGQALLCIR